ncbi:MAG: tetraacyldisaccharide 4'-kinase [Bacteroidales bacterium]|nr:tetraacyldisaccharide 4'-kinase [Bacteroidales bacterium]
MYLLNLENNSYFYPVVFLRIILFPFSLLYGLAVWLRNKLFDWNILPSKSFDIPVISVGNLSTGGTGKSPHVEYLVNLLKKDFIVATLSRGYKRKSKGFILADEKSDAKQMGDEPFQFKTKFPEVEVAVDEKRKRGIEKLLKLKPETDVVILDDAFQHRYVKPGISILLTDFHQLYCSDYVLPTGNLREFRSGSKRADIIIVTKTSKVLSPITRRRIDEQLKPAPNQKLFFSYIRHQNPVPLPGIKKAADPDKDARFNTILLVAGIANTYPLEMYLKNMCDELEVMKFPDHHSYVQKDIIRIIERFENIITRNKILVTTEKDSVRLRDPELMKTLKNFPVYYIPIEIVIHREDRREFNEIILNNVRKNKRDD